MAGLLSAPMPIERALVETFQRWAREPFHLVRANCAYSVLDYVEAVSGRRADPDPRAIGAHQKLSALRSDFSLESYARMVMDDLGWPVVADEARGDVGLVRLPTGLTACICAGGHDGPSLPSWVARTAAGFVSQPAAAQIAWRLPCPRR